MCSRDLLIYKQGWRVPPHAYAHKYGGVFKKELWGKSSCFQLSVFEMTMSSTGNEQEELEVWVQVQDYNLIDISYGGIAQKARVLW